MNEPEFKNLQCNYQEMYIRHAGQYVAMGWKNGQEYLFACDSKESARINAVCAGITSPVVIYCPRLKPWLLPSAKVLEELIQRLKEQEPFIKSCYSLTSQYKISLVGLEMMRDALIRDSRSQEQQTIVEELAQRASSPIASTQA